MSEEKNKDAKKWKSGKLKTNLRYAVTDAAPNEVWVRDLAQLLTETPAGLSVLRSMSSKMH